MKRSISLHPKDNDCFLRSHIIDVMVVAKARFDDLRTFSALLNGYEKIMCLSKLGSLEGK